MHRKTVHNSLISREGSVGRRVPQHSRCPGRRYLPALFTAGRSQTGPSVRTRPSGRLRFKHPTTKPYSPPNLFTSVCGIQALDPPRWSSPGLG
ncbi:hypothetical protein EVAR_27496_1 [Eumeta japonica]|uniref:Uncharacterized protein n=1 Tax=Eumeta variegata TaxID=151549 RepID=A0A4C1XH44_EUMVA|nr:hypothetical protein EVAR_27496_1 [Eumeta japonica]